MDFFYSAGNTLESASRTYLQFLVPLESVAGYRFLSGLVFLFLILSGWLFALYLQHVHNSRIGSLKGSLLELQSKEALLMESLLKQEKKYNSLTTSFQAYKKFLGSLKMRQREQALYIHTSLEVVQESLKNPIVRVSTQEREDIIHSCMMALKSLSQGFIIKMENGPIFLKKLLEKVSVVFADKSFHSNIYIEFTCPEDLTFYGDPLVIELILITLIGKSIYRTPKNEKVTIIVQEKEGTLYLEIRDRGYAFTRNEKFIKQAFHHFIGDDTLRLLGQENGFTYDCLKADDELNIVTLVMPMILPNTTSAPNVMHLFKKQPF